MSLNKQAGNMYHWVTHTWNPIKGKCPHKCSYCYMKRFSLKDIRLDEKELKTNLGKGNTIFVGSGCDMWANDVPTTWIWRVLKHCGAFENKYLFQSKNPERFYDFYFPAKTILGTTLESNRDYKISEAPMPKERAEVLREYNTLKMISIEPIMDFDIYDFCYMIRDIKPTFVSIGADSKGNKLPEPKPEKILKLINYLKVFTEVRVKDNLKRLVEVK